MTFPLDINKPGYPIEVLEAMIKDLVYYQMLDWRIEIPSVEKFLEGHVPDSGYGWETALLEASGDMSVELLEQWVAALKSGLCRAEMRSLLKQRKEED